MYLLRCYRCFCFFVFLLNCLWPLMATNMTYHFQFLVHKDLVIIKYNSVLRINRYLVISSKSFQNDFGFLTKTIDTTFKLDVVTQSVLKTCTNMWTKNGKRLTKFSSLRPPIRRNASFLKVFFLAPLMIPVAKETFKSRTIIYSHQTR